MVSSHPTPLTAKTKLKKHYTENNECVPLPAHEQVVVFIGFAVASIGFAVVFIGFAVVSIVVFIGFAVVSIGTPNRPTTYLTACTSEVNYENLNRTMSNLTVLNPKH